MQKLSLKQGEEAEVYHKNPDQTVQTFYPVVLTRATPIFLL